MPSSALYQHPLFQRHLFATPAVRHLAWLVHSRPLLRADSRDGAGQSSDESSGQPWPADVDDRLLALDRNPQALLDHLARRPSSRLGLYFEQLYGYALTALLGQRILAQNLPLRLHGRTLGELDFLVEDPASGCIVHHEIAVKFYMGWTGTALAGNPKPAGWYGPDNRDQLTTKLQRLREHQLPMGRGEHARQHLRDLGLAEAEASHLGLYGYLFRHQNGAIPALPPGIGEPEAGVSWRHAGERTSEIKGAFLAVLRKPHWLGPLQCPAEDLPDSGHNAAVLATAGSRPLLIATMARTEAGFWLESGRQFVTPDEWCLTG